MVRPYEDARWPPQEVLGAHQDTRWPPKHYVPITIGPVAQEDASWSPKRHVPTKKNRWVPTNIPGGTQKARCL